MTKLLRFIFQQVEVLFRASFGLFCELTNLEVLAGLCFSLVGLSRLLIFLFHFSFPAFNHLTFGSWHTKMPHEEGRGAAAPARAPRPPRWASHQTSDEVAAREPAALGPR